MGNSFKQKSDETWQQGINCLTDDMANMAANRLYYSVFQSIKGFAVGTKLWQPDEMNGVHGKALNIVCGPAKGVNWGFRQKLSELRGLREMADYQLENIDIEQLKALVKDADTLRKRYLDHADLEK